VIETMPEAVQQPAAPDFRELIAYVRPKPEETRWLDIPWQTDLWEGRRLAMAEGKPIFLWAMNGNPLGCT
jgi:hypothetical protein